MAERPYLMGIDFGTGGVRVGVFDREGAPVVFHGVEWETRFPRSGWAEQDPEEWWNSLVESNKALHEGGVSPEEIVDISTDATASMLLVMDENDRHMRLAIMWMDVRASDQAGRISKTGDPALKYNGFGAVSAGWGLPRAMWLKASL